MECFVLFLCDWGVDFGSVCGWFVCFEVKCYECCKDLCC